MAITNPLTNTQILQGLFGKANYEQRANLFSSMKMQSMHMSSAQFAIKYNEIISELVQRIGQTITLGNLPFNNPLAAFGRDIDLSFGQYVQMLSTDVIKAEDFDLGRVDASGNPVADPTTVDPWRRSLPTTHVEYVELNARRKYRLTIDYDPLRNAFTRDTGLSALIALWTEQITNSRNIDDYLFKKKIITKMVDDQNVQFLDLGFDPMADATTAEQLRQWLLLLKTTARDMQQPNNRFTAAGNMTWTTLADMVLVIRGNVLDRFDFTLKADIFNPQYIGMIQPSNVLVVDSLANTDIAAAFNARGLNTADEAVPAAPTGGKVIDAFLCAKDVAMHMNQLMTSASQGMNAEALYETMVFHTWDGYGYNTVRPAIAFGHTVAA